MKVKAHHAAGLIDGERASYGLGVSANESMELDGVYERLGLTEPGKKSIGETVLEEVSQLFACLGQSMRRYEEPSGFKRLLNWFGPPPRIDSVTVEVVSYSSFFAEAKKGASYPIEISAGLVLRMASLCNEYAAIMVEGSSPPATPSFAEAAPNGGLFFLMPKSEEGKNFARRLLMIGMLFLFGHEFSHVSHGHCDLFFESPNMSVDDRAAMELDADMGSGAFAACSIIQSAGVMELLMYAPDDFAPTRIMNPVCDAMMAGLMLFTLFEAFTKTCSEMYLVPIFRWKNFIANFVAYLGWSSTAPIRPLVQIDPKTLNQENLDVAYRLCLSQFMRTSAGTVLENASATKTDLDRAEYVASVRERLKGKLLPLQPFGVPEYLAQLSKSKAP